MGGGYSLPPPPPLIEEPKNTELYMIRVYSGKHRDSGWNASVSYTLVGERGQSKKQHVSSVVPASLGDDGVFTMSQLADGTHVENFSFTTGTDLGEIGVVIFQNDGGGPFGDWEVHKVVVEKVIEGGLESATYWHQWVLPCYSWVHGKEKRHFFEATAILPQNTPRWIKKYRKKELEYMQKVYRYKYAINKKTGGGALALPNPCAVDRARHLPRDERPPGAPDAADISAQAAQLLSERGLSHLVGDKDPWKALNPTDLREGTLLGEVFVPYNATSRPEGGTQGQEHKIKGLPMPDVLKDGRAWIDDDHEFVRQLMQGPIANSMVTCSEIPEAMDVAYIDEQLAACDIMRLGRSLAGEAQVGRVMVVDFSELRTYMVMEEEPGGGPPSGQGGGRKVRKYAGAAPMLLLYLAEDPDTQESVCLPVAIKLNPNNEDAPIFTPNCYQYDWLSAKVYFFNALAQVHMMRTYYLESLAVVEPFALSLHRQMSAAHPVYRLLRPYLRYSISTCVEARRWLTGPTGLLQSCFTCGAKAQRLIEEAYSNWNLDETGLPQSLVKRGFDGNEKLEFYPYRDDGMLVWAAIVDHVLDYLTIYYESDYDVIQDKELQAWWSETMMVGHNGRVPEGEAPAPILDYDRLSMICTILIWTTTAYHSCAAHGVYEYYAFPSNMPTILHLPPMHTLDAATHDKFSMMLPTKGETVVVQAFMHQIAKRKDHSQSLGEFNEEWFVDEETVAVFEKFRNNCRHVEAMCQIRNEKRDVPYDIMRPETITKCCGT